MKNYFIVMICWPCVAWGMSKELVDRESAKSVDLATRLVRVHPYVDSHPKMIQLLAATIAANPARLSALKKAISKRERECKQILGGANFRVDHAARVMLDALAMAQEKAERDRRRALLFGMFAGSLAGMILLAQLARLTA